MIEEHGIATKLCFADLVGTIIMYRQDEEEAILVMGDEEYDEPDELLAGLPERVLLSDFVESQEPVANAIAKVRTHNSVQCAIRSNLSARMSTPLPQPRYRRCFGRIHTYIPARRTHFVTSRRQKGASYISCVGEGVHTTYWCMFAVLSVRPR